MMRSDMPKQVQVFRNGGGIASLATVPMDGMVGNQPHRLAYINPDEEKLLKALGGSGQPGPGGIPMYNAFTDTLKEIFSGGKAVTKTYNSDEYSSGTTSAPSGNVDFTTINPSTGNQTRVATIDYGDDDDDGPLINNVTYYDKTGNNIIAAPAAPSVVEQYIRPINATYPLDIDSKVEKPLVTSSGPSYTPPSDDGPSYVAPEPEPDPTVLTPFQFTNDQLTAQSDFMKRIGGIQSQYTPEQLQSFDIRQQLSSQIVPTAEEFMAITGASEDLTNQLLATPGQFDLRDWSKIMSSDNPLEAAQAATAAIYLTEGLYGRGQEIAPELQLSNLDNLIGETDQLFAYGDADDVRLGIKTAGGVKLADLGSINSPDFYNVLQGYGYGAEDVAELVPSIEKYYGENVEFKPVYKPVEGLDYDYQTYYTPEQVQMYNEYYANLDDPEKAMPLLFDDPTYGQYFLTNAPAGRPGDPYNLLGGLQSAAPGTLTKDLGLGQSFLYSSTPGYYGLADPVMLQPTTTSTAGTSGIGTIDTGMNTTTQQTNAAQQIIDNQYSIGQPSAPVVYGNPLTPNTGVQSSGIMGVQTQPITPFQPTVYNPGVYVPPVSPLTLPPLG